MTTTRKTTPKRTTFGVIWDRMESGTTGFQKRVTKEAKRLRREAKKLQRTVQRDVQKLQKDWQKRAEGVRVQAYHAAGIATKSDLDKISRKLSTITRKITAA